jgi:3-deoxy-7-phosphoheptulonate synthase
MIVQLQNNITEILKQGIISKILQIGLKTTEVKTQSCNYLICIGEKDFDIRVIGNLEGVKDVHRVTDSYKLVSRKWKVKDTAIDLGDGITISRDNLTLIAGPCSIENEEQIKKTSEHLQRNEIRIMRGGVFKPRSSPYSFRGVGIEGLRIFSEICRKIGIKIITEVMQVSQIEEMQEYTDIYQVGARNVQNFNLLDELGKTDKPVMIKRGFSTTLDELLYSAEYVFSNGNEKIILCERGVRSFEKSYRNMLDLNSIPYLKKKTHLPVFVDPSHGVGIRSYIQDMSLAGIMAGADGIMIEIHETPEKAMSDGQQTLNFEEAEKLYNSARKTYDLKKTFD